MQLKNETAAKDAGEIRDEKETLRKRFRESPGQGKKTEKEASHIEAKALRYDFGEGLLEIGLVLTSLYFIARSKLFPVPGLISASAETVVALMGYFS